ncbi:MAG: hypothetical protein AB7E85_06880 [Pseudobdellovibrionaceae bacterium]
MLHEREPLLPDDAEALTTLAHSWEPATKPISPTNIRLTWSQDMTLRGYSAARTLGGIAMEHFEDKPWLVPVYLVPIPIPAVKSWVIYAYMAAATMRSEDPDLVRLRGELVQALRTPANVEDLNRYIPEAVAHDAQSGKADISYKSILKTALRDFGIANKRLFAASVRQYPGLFIGLPMAAHADRAKLDHVVSPLRIHPDHTLEMATSYDFAPHGVHAPAQNQ